MGTIVTRKRANGTAAHMAKIIIKRDGKVVHRESKTFDRRPAAAGWIARREEELSQPGQIERESAEKITLRKVIEQYRTESATVIRRSKAQSLNMLLRFPIVDMACDEIASQHIVTLAQELSQGRHSNKKYEKQPDKRQPQTVAGYLSHLSPIFEIAKPAWGYPLDKSAFDDAYVVLKRLGLVGKSNVRERRPTMDELEKLMTFFAGRKSTAAPMSKIVPFALFSTRRQEEITNIQWTDLDEKHSRIMVRDMKNPTEKAGNHVWCDLPEPALKIIQSMPRGGDRIFPYVPETLGTAFRDGCELLGIEDLHFHDLRHEGVSRLFEMGFNIPHVAAVSGHRSWQSLKRYTHVRQSGDKYEGWKWLDAATKKPGAEPGSCDDMESA